MFSRLEPILYPVVRRTESADARLEIRRDESKEQGGRKRGQDEADYAPVPWEDMAGVSTAALLAFLQSLIGGAAIGAATSQAAAQEAPRSEPTTLGSRATNAYQTMGRAVHDKNVISEPTPALPPVAVAEPHPETSVIGHEFNEDEIAQVHGFIGDLIELQRRGITELTIQRSLTFLDSVRQGIAEGRSRISGA